MLASVPLPAAGGSPRNVSAYPGINKATVPAPAVSSPAVVPSSFPPTAPAQSQQQPPQVTGVTSSSAPVTGLVNPALAALNGYPAIAPNTNGYWPPLSGPTSVPPMQPPPPLPPQQQQQALQQQFHLMQQQQQHQQAMQQQFLQQQQQVCGRMGRGVCVLHACCCTETEI